MAEYDDIKVGNLYRTSGALQNYTRYFVILSMERKNNVITVRKTNDVKTDPYIDVRVEDTFLELTIMFVNDHRIEGRRTTVSQFWTAYDCVAEVP